MAGEVPVLLAGGFQGLGRLLSLIPSSQAADVGTGSMVGVRSTQSRVSRSGCRVGS